jgi:hypothetical protein
MDRTPKHFLILIGLFLISCQSAFTQELSVGEIAKKLRAIQFKEEDFPYYDVPKAAQELLPFFRRGVREAIFSEIASETPPVVHSEDLRARILAKLRNAGLALSHDDNSAYGNLRELDVQTPGTNSGLLAIKVTLGISCGVDSSLYLFHRRGSGWEPIIILEPGPYDQVNGAMENLEYRISPPDNSGNWYLLVAYSRPWCTSCWSSAHYKVMRKSTDPENPLLVYEASGGLYRCANQSFRLTANKNEFSLSYPNMMLGDLNLFAKISVDRFQIDRMGVQRLPPRVQPPVDFVDQWLELPEDEAMKMVSEPTRTSAAEWHRLLSRKTVDSEQLSYESSYDLVRQCQGKRGSWVVGLSISENKQTRKSQIPGHVYFELETGKSGLVLRGIDQAWPKQCQGRDEKPTGADINDLQLPE